MNGWLSPAKNLSDPFPCLCLFEFARRQRVLKFSRTRRLQFCSSSGHCVLCPEYDGSGTRLKWLRPLSSVPWKPQEDKVQPSCRENAEQKGTESRNPPPHTAIWRLRSSNVWNQLAGEHESFTDYRRNNLTYYTFDSLFIKHRTRTCTNPLRNAAATLARGAISCSLLNWAAY